MIFYWKTILELELTILVFIRSIRESNFSLSVISLRSLMKWYFSMDHYNYASWLSVHLFDLVQLQYTLPDVDEHFNKGHFTFQENQKPIL